MERQPINGLKIIYDNKTYDKILYISISNISEYNNYQVSFTSIENYQVSFTSIESEKETLNINCMLKDVEIITK